MRYRVLGNSGISVSTVGLGCNNFGSRIGLSIAREVVDEALRCGINLLDTAESYGRGGGSEEILGEVLRGRRDKVVLATKFGDQFTDMRYDAGLGPKGSRTYIKHAVEQSLRRLRTDYIDLYQLHWPDPETPIEETLSALDELVQSGLVRAIGYSNFSAEQMAAASTRSKACHAEFVSSQNHWSLLERGVEDQVVPMARQLGVAVLAYFPLEKGLLTGKVKRGQRPPEGSRLADQPGYITPSKLDKIEALDRWANDNGRTLLDLAIGGLAATAGCTSVITGATTPWQIAANSAAGDWIPSTRDLRAICTIAELTDGK